MTYSPVARFTSIRIVLALSALFGYKVHQMNIYSVSQFIVEEEVYIEGPPGFILLLGRVYHLDKCLYGLNESLRE